MPTVQQVPTPAITAPTHRRLNGCGQSTERREHMEKRPLPTALYCRLSREDGDRMESDSIGNQRKLLEEYIENHPELTVAECYADDGYTGTNFAGVR